MIILGMTLLSFYASFMILLSDVKEVSGWSGIFNLFMGVLGAGDSDIYASFLLQLYVAFSRSPPW